MPADEPNAAQSKSLRRAGLIMLVMLSVSLRLIGLHSQSLTVDECLERQTAEMPTKQLIFFPNSFPPLYHLLAKCWLMVDSSEWSLRHLSVLIGVLSVLALRTLVAEGVSDQVGWIAGVLAAVSPFHIYYSQEGRCYILYLLFGIWAMHYGLRLLRGGTRGDAIKFVAAGVAGGYTHYYMAAMLAGVGIGVLLTKGLAYFGKHMLPAALAIGALCTPLIGLVQDDLHYQVRIRAPRPASIAAIGYTFFSFESGYTLGPSRSQLHSQDAKRQALSDLSPWVVLAFPVVMILLINGVLEVRRIGELAYWMSVIVVPFIMVAALCYSFGVTYNTRFMVCCWAPYTLLMATAIARVRLPIRILAIAVLGTLYIVAIYNRNFVFDYQNEDARGAAAFLNSADPRPTYICSGYMSVPVQYYAEQPRFVVALPDLGGASGSVEAAVSTVDSKPFWLLYTREFHGDPHGEILQRLKDERGLKSIHTLAGIEIFEGAKR